MKSVNLADAKAHLSKLVERAAGGEAVCITRRGKAVAQITAIDTPRKRIDPRSKLILVQTAVDYSEEVWQLWSALVEQFG